MKDEFLLADLKLKVYQEWVLLVKQNLSLISGRLKIDKFYSLQLFILKKDVSKVKLQYFWPIANIMKNAV